MQMRHVLTAMMIALAALLLPAGPSLAQSDAASFLNPFPAGDVHKVLMVGDDLADGLLYGMTEAFTGDTRVEINKRHQVISGLTRNDFDDRLRNLEDLIGREPHSVAVVMLGAWDRNSLKDANGKRLAVGSVEWRAVYGKRVDRVVRALKARNIAVYWVGLPNVRRPDMDEDVKMMNEIIRERVYVNGMKYIDSYAGFVDEQGGFSAYGPDQTGKMRLLREGDGVYLTSAGNRKLAFFVERELKRDLSQAKADRNIPLAGSEPEQAKIHPEKAAAAQAPEPTVAAPVMPDSAANERGASASEQNGAAPAGVSDGAVDATQQAVRVTPAQPAPPPPATDQKADNGKISLKMVTQSGREETVAVDIVRPAIPASVVALVTRRESPDKPTQMGEQLVDQITGGLTVMSSVTPSSTVTASGGTRRLSPTQSPYYRVLMKGERLVPRKGRADDFSWPRPDTPVTRSSAAAPRDGPGANTSTSLATGAVQAKPATAGDSQRAERVTP